MNEETYKGLLERMITAAGELEDISMQLDGLRIDDMASKELWRAQKSAAEAFDLIDDFLGSVDAYGESQ